MSNLNSRRASKNKPCKICGEANGWCLHLDSIDGMLCMKHELPGCERKKLKNGEIGFQYGPSYFNDGKPVKQYIQAPKKEVQTLEVPLADIEVRHQVYTNLIEALDLFPNHILHLNEQRCLPIEKIITNYATITDQDNWRETVIKEFSKSNNLKGIPGFYTHYGQWKMAGPEGFMIAARNINGQIKGMQIRKDGITKGSKYRWLSTPPDSYENGVSSGVHNHFGNAKKKCLDVWICEGVLKSDVAAANSTESFIGTAGCFLGETEEYIESFSRIALPRFILCPDADFRDNWHVYNAVKSNIESLATFTQEIRVAVWEPDEGKGIDDFILNTGRMPKHLSPWKWIEKFKEPPRKQPANCNIKEQELATV